MEPPPFGDGNLTLHTNGKGEQGDLQWSHRLLAMVTSKPIADMSALASLQWSHRLLAMVTRQSCGGYPPSA